MDPCSSYFCSEELVFPESPRPVRRKEDPQIKKEVLLYQRIQHSLTPRVLQPYPQPTTKENGLGENIDLRV